MCVRYFQVARNPLSVLSEVFPTVARALPAHAAREGVGVGACLGCAREHATAPDAPGHGERSRLQLLFRLGGIDCIAVSMNCVSFV